MAKKHISQELPIRLKLEMVEDIVKIMRCLQDNQMDSAKPFLDDLKKRSIYLDEQIQRAVLIFNEQIQFQSVYDPTHGININIQQAADQLLESLGFSPPR